MDERTLIIVNAFFREDGVPKLKSLLRARLARDLRLPIDEAMMLVEVLITARVINEITVRCERDGWKQSILELADDGDSTVVAAVITRRYER